MKKRLFSMFLSLVMVLSLMPAAFAAEGEGNYDDYLYENGIVYKVEGDSRTELSEEEIAVLDGVSLHGIADFNGKIFPTMQAAYDAISAKLTEVGGLGEVGLDDETFQALYTDKVPAGDTHQGVSLTWTIFGTVAIGSDLPSYYLSGGRAAAWYGSDSKTIRCINVVGYDGNSTLNISKNPTMPYQWWGSETTDEYMGFAMQNLTVNVVNMSQLSINSNYRTGFDVSLDRCVINGAIYHYFNGKCTLSVDQCTFNGSGTTTSYALMAQGHVSESMKVYFTNNVVSGYSRGINIDQITADVTITGNTITPGVGYSAIQLSGFRTALVEENIVYDQGNFLTFHENLAKNPITDRTVTVQHNKVHAVDRIQGYLIYDDIEKAGSYGDTSFFTLNWNDNTVDKSIITNQGIKGDVVSDISSYLEAILDPPVQIGDQRYPTLADAIDAASQMSGNVTITLLGDVDVSDASARTYDLSASTSLTGLTIRGASQNVQIISGVDGNDIDGPNRCPVLTVKLPGTAPLTIENLTFPDDLLFDTSKGGTLVVQNCVFNGAQSGYPQAGNISYLNNTFKFEGTAGNFYSHNAYPVWYKTTGDLDFIFEGNTVTGYRGVHIETRGNDSGISVHNVNITVDNNHFYLSDTDHENKTVALQLVRNVNGDISFTNNYVEGYMAVCFYNGIKRIDGSLDIQNNQLSSGCKLYGSNEWHSDASIADAFAQAFVNGIPSESKTISAGHTKHHYVNGVCTICGEKKPVPVEPSEPSEPSTPVGDYLVSVDKTTGGKVTVNPGRADKGDTVTITVRPDKGYELDSLTVTAKNGDTIKLTEKSSNKFTFKMPGSKVTVEAVFVKEDSEKPVVTLPFADVNKGDWFYDAVEYVYSNDLMNGTSATAFSPYLTTSRAMMLTMLARYDGVDTTTGSTWYEAGAVWAVAEGISDGTNLEADLTREQLVTMLWRYTGSPVVESGLSAYPDGASVSDWAVNAMIWATQTGVITGNGAGALAPQGAATRAEVATILARFCAGK